MNSAKERLNHIVSLYSKIKRFPDAYKNKNIFNIDKPMRWLYADETNQYVSVFRKNIEYNLFDIDITGCFPTICKYLFKNENPQFVEKIESLSDKTKKNIFIANTLKNTSYLRILNIISKMVILGYVFDRDDSEKNSLLEFEKDGCLILSIDKTLYNNIKNNYIDSEFLQFIYENNFVFHIIDFDYYIRCNNTSIFWKDKDEYIRFKGMYKHIPLKIKELYCNVFKGNNVNLKEFLEIYNINCLKIIINNNLNEIIENYYYCGDVIDRKILNNIGKYEKYQWKKSNISPEMYLKFFIFPLILFKQRNLNNTF